MRKWIVMIACTLSLVNTAVPMEKDKDKSVVVDIDDLGKDTQNQPDDFIRFTKDKSKFKGLDIRPLRKKLHTLQKKDPATYQQLSDKLDKTKTRGNVLVDNPEAAAQIKEATVDLLTLLTKSSQDQAKTNQRNFYIATAASVGLGIVTIVLGSLNGECG